MSGAVKFLGGLCFITDRKLSSLTNEEMVRAALKAGVKWVQYRDKEKSRRESYFECEMLREVTKTFGATFVVNDYADIALAVGADGVHLGQDDLPIGEARRIFGRGIIGISTHSLAEAVKAEESGADYIGFGPIYPTTTKAAGEPKDVSILREIRRHVKIPIAAIGGITLENLAPVLEAGADAVAVASAIVKGDVCENAKSFMSVLGRI